MMPASPRTYLMCHEHLLGLYRAPTLNIMSGDNFMYLRMIVRTESLVIFSDDLRLVTASALDQLE